MFIEITLTGSDEKVYINPKFIGAIFPLDSDSARIHTLTGVKIQAYATPKSIIDDIKTANIIYSSDCLE